MIKILDLEQEPVSKYVENIALKMNDVFKIEAVRKLERRLSTFLQQSNAEILKNDKENVTFLTQEFRPTADELIDPGVPNLEKDIYSRHLESRIEKEMSIIDRSLNFQVAMSRLQRTNLIKRLINESEK